MSVHWEKKKGKNVWINASYLLCDVVISRGLATVKEEEEEEEEEKDHLHTSSTTGNIKQTEP